MEIHVKKFADEARGEPFDNNGLEACDRWTKKQGVLWKRSNLGEFFVAIEESLVGKWSLDRSDDEVNKKEFYHQPQIMNPLWVSANQWALAVGSNVISIKKDGQSSYFS